MDQKGETTVCSLFLNIKTQIKGIRMKKFVTGFQKNVRVAILVFAQSTIQCKKVTRIKRGIFYDKGVKSPIRHNNSHCLCT